MDNKAPAFQFYVGDWLKDHNLRRCSHAARGVWMDMLCLMWQCDQRGVLATGGVPWTIDEIALAVGGDKGVTLACIEELTLKGVAKRTANGAMYSSRQVRDDHKRKACSEAGKRGGNPVLGSTLKGQPKGGPKGDAKGGPKPKPTPSSSSSSSSSSIPPLPPLGGLVVVPDVLQASPEFVSAWSDWLAYRRERKLTTGQRCLSAQLTMLASHPPAVAAAMLRQSILQGWQGLFELKEQGNVSSSRRPNDGRPATAETGQLPDGIRVDA